MRVCGSVTEQWAGVSEGQEPEARPTRPGPLWEGHAVHGAESEPGAGREHHAQDRKVSWPQLVGISSSVPCLPTGRCPPAAARAPPGAGTGPALTCTWTGSGNSTAGADLRLSL